MKSILIILVALLLSVLSYGQSSKFALSGYFGLAGNFFVRSYEEDGGPIANKRYFYKKDFIGSIGGVEAAYDLNSRSRIGVGYSREIHKGRKNFQGYNGTTEVQIEDFTLRHINNFFQGFYERTFRKGNSAWKYHLGAVIAAMHQQEVENLPNLVSLQERTPANSGLVEGGVFGGVHYVKRIDTHFELGLQVRGYYLLSVQQLEAITLTPTLTYHF